jgi:large subunit ribosomal protein L17
MRHKFANKTLTRNTNYTETLLYNMALSLVTHKRIKTTLVKAKALRSYVEKLVTLARRGSSQENFTLLSGKLRSNESFVRNIIELSKAYQERPGGYTRVLKLGKRQGDNADIALIEFV